MSYKPPKKYYKTIADYTLLINNTKSAKRHLKKLSGKENRFKTDVNHCISKDIINSVPENSILVLEKLKNIRKSKMRKKQRIELNSWKFYQLEQFLIYKAETKNCKIEFVNPAYTSQTCSNCGDVKRSNRKANKFKCKTCKFELHADLNAARNIRDKFSNSYKLFVMAEINQPIVSPILVGTNSD